MIEMSIILGLATGITNLVKKYISANLVPFLTLSLIVVLNIGNALIFGNGDLVLAAKDAIISGAIFTGMFVAGDKIRQSEGNEIKSDR